MRRPLALVALALVASALILSAATIAAPSCDGAAAFDPARGCTAPHKTAVKPHPDVAILEHGPPCVRMRAVQEPGQSCWFPSSARRKRITAALIGDSHGAVWRAPVSPLVASLRRRAISFTLASCPLARTERLNVSDDRMADCRAWGDRVTNWLRRHPRVRTVFFVNSSTYDFAPSGDKSGFDRGVEGYRAAFESLPPSVKQIVVIRDNPHMRYDTNTCVARAIERRRPPGPACALPREEALRPDAAATAATLTGGRVTLVDLTSFFCDEQLCYPTIGGVLVYRDVQHLARKYGHSLWPYLRARLPTA